MYKQVLDPVSNSLGLTAIFAVLPLILLFVLLGVVRMKAWLASLLALAVAAGVAVVVYGCPLGRPGTLRSRVPCSAFGRSCGSSSTPSGSTT
jgi:lactate permease